MTFYIYEETISEVDAPDAQTAINLFLESPGKYLHHVEERNITDASGDFPDCDECRKKNEPPPETICRRCKRPTEYQAALCYSCEISLYGDL